MAEVYVQNWRQDTDPYSETAFPNDPGLYIQAFSDSRFEFPISHPHRVIDNPIVLKSASLILKLKATIKPVDFDH